VFLLVLVGKTKAIVPAEICATCPRRLSFGTVDWGRKPKRKLTIPGSAGKPPLKECDADHLQFRVACAGVYVNGYRVIDMDIAGHGSVDTTGDVILARHSFFLPQPEYVI